MTLLPTTVLPAYGLEAATAKIEAHGSGLINHTWKVTAQGKNYILQRVNAAVFQQPQHIAHNIKTIATFLQQHAPHYLFVAPLLSRSGDELVNAEQGFYRMFPFVVGSRSMDVVQTPRQAFEAARQFGLFTQLLSGLDVTRLKITIPFFHDLELRYNQFLLALERGNPQRLADSAHLITELQHHANLVVTYRQIKSNPNFKLRVTHHDTKISNVLFDADGNGLCVIDLDTVMPGYFISDVGDMMRTYLSPVSEEEKDFRKIRVRTEMYDAIVKGYYSQMKDVLTSDEKQAFFYAGQFMIYMQALRFLTDHLNNDVYYGARYEGHNLVRAQNQSILLQRLVEKERELKAIL